MYQQTTEQLHFPGRETPELILDTQRASRTQLLFSFLHLLNFWLLFSWLLWSSVLWGLISKYYDWTSSAGLLSEWCNWCENMTGYTPPVIPLCLAGTSHCLLSTWLESTSEVWSSTVRVIEEDWGPLKREALFNFFCQCQPPASLCTQGWY